MESLVRYGSYTWRSLKFHSNIFHRSVHNVSIAECILTSWTLMLYVIIEDGGNGQVIGPVEHLVVVHLNGKPSPRPKKKEAGRVAWHNRGRMAACWMHWYWFVFILQRGARQDSVAVRVHVGTSERWSLLHTLLPLFAPPPHPSSYIYSWPVSIVHLLLYHSGNAWLADVNLHRLIWKGVRT